MRPSYEPKVTLGNLIQLATTLLLLAGLYYGLVGRLEKLELSQSLRDQRISERLIEIDAQSRERTAQVDAQNRERAAQVASLQDQVRRLRERLIDADVLQPE